MSYKILSKFIKDISFEIPDVQTFTMIEKDISKYNLLFDIKSKPFKNNVIEVNTILRLNAPEEIKHKINAEINYTALVAIDGPKDKEKLEKIILIEVPTEIYPALYEIFIYLFTQTGIKNLRIDKEINFEKFYNDKLKSQK
jgi:preprotein translocase subunit SecB